MASKRGRQNATATIAHMAQQLSKTIEKHHSDCELQQLSRYEKVRPRHCAGTSYCVPLAHHGNSTYLVVVAAALAVAVAFQRYTPATPVLSQGRDRFRRGLTMSTASAKASAYHAYRTRNKRTLWKEISRNVYPLFSLLIIEITYSPLLTNNYILDEALSLESIHLSARLRWLGHVERMGEDRAAKRAYLGQPTGRRPIGRPRYRWLDEVRKDLCDMQVADWRLVVQDRNNWRSLVSEAKIHFGSLSRRSNTIPQSEMFSQDVLDGSKRPLNVTVSSTCGDNEPVMFRTGTLIVFVSRPIPKSVRQPLGPPSLSGSAVDQSERVHLIRAHKCITSQNICTRTYSKANERSYAENGSNVNEVEERLEVSRVVEAKVMVGDYGALGAVTPHCHQQVPTGSPHPLLHACAVALQSPIRGKMKLHTLQIIIQVVGGHHIEQSDVFSEVGASARASRSGPRVAYFTYALYIGLHSLLLARAEAPTSDW
ncbi:hypothetical protein MSG28_006924 [Choristoneura fumiferana]|uniref:Uncharacterized protein n=1 Tax=Choristoneura fumiferana TaxID=7141 RepID=A0ACC0JM09_CHOFU|nr:hypothetical protein MSG28_006924 [Choristoneura fumiferana]